MASDLSLSMVASGITGVSFSVDSSATASAFSIPVTLVVVDSGEVSLLFPGNAGDGDVLKTPPVPTSPTERSNRQAM